MTQALRAEWGCAWGVAGHPPKSPSRCAHQVCPPGVSSKHALQAHPPGVPSRCALQACLPGAPPGTPSRCALQVCPPGVSLQVHPPGVPSRHVLQVCPPGAPSRRLLQVFHPETLPMGTPPPRTPQQKDNIPTSPRSLAKELLAEAGGGRDGACRVQPSHGQDEPPGSVTLASGPEAPPGPQRLCL